MSIRQAALVSEQLNQEIGKKPFEFAANWWSDNAPKARECEPTFTLDRQIAEARQEMGEDRWAELQAEWRS